MILEFLQILNQIISDQMNTRTLTIICLVKLCFLSSASVGIVNRDDEHFDRIIEGHTCTLETYGFSKEADLQR